MISLCYCIFTFCNLGTFINKRAMIHGEQRAVGSSAALHGNRMKEVTDILVIQLEQFYLGYAFLAEHHI